MIVSNPKSNEGHQHTFNEPLSEETLAYLRQLEHERDEAIHTLKMIQTCFESPELHDRVQRFLSKLSPPHALDG